jgi:hypothetical protein
MDGPAGVKKVAGTGTEQTRFSSENPSVPSDCCADFSAEHSKRLEVLARAVALVAGMPIPQADQEVVLARTNAAIQATPQNPP